MTGQTVHCAGTCTVQTRLGLCCVKDVCRHRPCSVQDMHRQ